MCRRGDWQGGIARLRMVVSESGSLEWVPGLVYSYLGYGLAAAGDEYEEGVRYCESAVRQEVWEPEHYLNLARTYLLRKDRRRAVRVLDLGLRLDAAHPALRALRSQLGWRRRSTFPFLPRAHALNRWTGSLRQQLRDAFAKPPAAAEARSVRGKRAVAPERARAAIRG